MKEWRLYEKNKFQDCFFTIFTVLILALVLQGAFLVSQLSLNKFVEGQNRVLLEEAFNRLIKSEVETVVSNIKGIHEYKLAKGVPEAEIKKEIAEYVRKIHYGDSGYFWIDDKDGNNVLLDPKREVEGTNRYEAVDQNGTYYIKDIINNGLKEGGGFSTYYFPKPNEEIAKKKIAYSLSYKPFNWVIGIGNYVDDIDLVVAAEAKKIQGKIYQSISISVAIALALVAVFSLIASVYGNKISSPIVSLNKTIKQAAQGDLTVQTDVHSNDEAGELAQSFNIMISNLRAITQDITTLSTSLSNDFIKIERIVEDVSKGSDEIAKTIQDLAEGVGNQVAATGNVNKNIYNIVEHLEDMNSNMD